MATIPKIDRARIIMDLVKDGEVSDLANYSAVEKAASPLALKYAQAFWDAPGFSHEKEVNPTNDQLATNYINRLRDYHKQVLAAARVPAAGETARRAETATVVAEGTTDLNDDES